MPPIKFKFVVSFTSQVRKRNVMSSLLGGNKRQDTKFAKTGKRGGGGLRFFSS